MKRFTHKSIWLGLVCFTIAAVFLINACNKSSKQSAAPNTNAVVANETPAPVVQKNTLSQVVTVAFMDKSDDGSYTAVGFHQNAESFMVTDPTIISSLQKALNEKKTIKITYNPWSATVLSVTDANQGEISAVATRQMSTEQGYYQRIDIAKMNDDVMNTPTPAMGVLNTTESGLINVVPDMATAQSMFDYIAHQCCALPGPYQIDHCISFQYCEDGCYARAHKMCWIINNKYNYATHKIFSFAYPSGSHKLSVKAEKWGGCCICWWYHVAPLLNIKTPSGIKAYVFDPAMFDQPVPLATWLHAQANPACSTLAGVTSINIQPTSSYSPTDTAHFYTDPTYSNTNSTLISYAPLVTCP